MLNAQLLHSRIQDRKIEANLISNVYLEYKLDQVRRDWYHDELLKANKSSINTDFLPSAVFLDLAYWNSLNSPKLTKFFKQMSLLHIEYIILILLLFYVLNFYLQRRYKFCRKASISIAILTTGFVGMGVMMLLVLTFQSFYGYVYYWIGFLITAFMAGLMVGSMYMTKLLATIGWAQNLFLKTEVYIVSYMLVLFAFYLFSEHIQHSDIFLTLFQYVLLILAIICGFLVGVQFPLANKLFLDKWAHLTKTAGTLYALDLLGAWLGSIIISLVLIPILGIIKTCFIILFIKLLSMISFKYAKH
jgi:spermidine synthase